MNNVAIIAEASFYLTPVDAQGRELPNQISAPGKQYLVPEEEAAHLINEKVAKLVEAASMVAKNTTPEIRDAEKQPTVPAQLKPDGKSD